MRILIPLLASLNIYGGTFPYICNVVNSPAFKAILDLKYSISLCGKLPPRPCAHFKYYVPKYFIEVVPKIEDSFFNRWPGVELQKKSIKKFHPTGFDDDGGSFSYSAHIMRVPFSNIAFSGMPCGKKIKPDLFCFSSMSEHLGKKWTEGSGDRLQPSWLAWKSSPKECLLSGAAMSTAGNVNLGLNYGTDLGLCSVNNNFIRIFPPSAYPVCTGWGIHFPRTGIVESSDNVTASLMIASRMKSISSELLQSFNGVGDEKWQMVIPQKSKAFKEGQNMGILTALGAGSEVGRISGGPKNGFLYAIWQKVSCTKDLPEIAIAHAWREALYLACKGAN